MTGNFIDKTAIENLKINAQSSMVLENFISLIDKWINWFANPMCSIKSTLCSTQCDRVEIDGLLIVDSWQL